MGKTAIITGASRGIGRAIAESFAKSGYSVHLICHKSIDAINELAGYLANTYAVDAFAHIGDVSDSTFAKKVFEKLEHVDVLVNNAGISYVGLLTDMTDEDWHKTISTNLDSVFYFSREAAKLMLKEHAGSIINISSVWGSQGASMEVAYSASKGGVNAFTKALAKELAPSHIAVNAISCGLIDTSMNGHLSTEDMDALINEIPANRIGQPEEIANIVLSLANSSDYLTGQIITVDGGWI